MMAQDQLSLLTFDKLRVKPPISSNSVRHFDHEIVAQDARDTHIAIHPRFPALEEAFLEFKRAHGSRYEKQAYGTPETFTWRQEVSRLVEKRPLVSMGGMDHTMLRDGRIPRADMTKEWDRNGMDLQHMNEYLTLDDYLSYDEIMLSSLVGVSGPSYFFNDGNRYNKGRPGEQGTFEPRGIIIGLVGARFEREGRVDSVHILPPVSKPSHGTQLPKFFQDFFGVPRDPPFEFDVAT